MSAATKHTQTRTFHIGDILSVTTGYYVGPTNFGAVHELIEYLLDSPIFTHSLPRVFEPCRKALLAQHPDLADADCTGVTPDNHAERLAALVARYGEYRDVAPLAGGEYAPRDPLSELAEMMGARNQP